MRRSGQLAPAVRPGQRPDRAALRQRRLSQPLQRPRRRRLRRGQLLPVHLDGAPGPIRPLPQDGRAGQGGRQARLLPARAERRAPAAPTPTTPCSATSRPCRRPGSTTGRNVPTARRRRSAAGSPSTAPPGRLPRQRRPRHAVRLVRVRGARPLPGGARRRAARGRQPAVRARRDQPAAPQAGADHRHRLHLHEAEAARRARSTKSRRSRAKSPSARRALHTYAGCGSMATPMASPGPPTARWPAAAASPSSSGPNPTASGETPPPRFRPRSARTGGCRKAPARPERGDPSALSLL